MSLVLISYVGMGFFDFYVVRNNYIVYIPVYVAGSPILNSGVQNQYKIWKSERNWVQKYNCAVQFNMLRCSKHTELASELARNPYPFFQILATNNWLLQFHQNHCQSVYGKVLYILEFQVFLSSTSAWGITELLRTEIFCFHFSQ